MNKIVSVCSISRGFSEYHWLPLPSLVSRVSETLGHEASDPSVCPPAFVIVPAAWTVLSFH